MDNEVNDNNEIIEYAEQTACGRTCDGCEQAGADKSECTACESKDSCCRSHCSEPRGKLFGYNWLDGISDATNFDIVEVQFKNTRKGFYKNTQNLDLHIGDMVAVEAAPGHDIGQITMVGKLVTLHMRKANIKPETELKKVFRIARPADLEKYDEAKSREHDTMIRSRKIAEELNLNMKIGDVEYQGDGAKAIFYYIADERVDFRKLIRVLADTFKVRIEMKQIGARQEAGRIGGIGPCGRPLCCSSWLTNFVSVGTNAARVQDISMNPQKLAGQCAKLKCCLNFEVDVYMESSAKLPSKDIALETKDATYYYFKSDILSGNITYSTDKKMPVNCVTISADRAKEIIQLNKEGEKPDTLLKEGAPQKARSEFVDLVGQDNIERFDKTKRKKKRRSSLSQTRESKPDSQSNGNTETIASPTERKQHSGSHQLVSSENREQIKKNSGRRYSSGRKDNRGKNENRQSKNRVKE